MPSYRYSGDFLAKAGEAFFDPQKKNMAILELTPPAAGGVAGKVKDTTPLVLSVKTFKIPGRKVGSGDMHFLNGVTHYPTKPEPQEDITVTFRDFPNGGTRATLVRWFSGVYDEVSGAMLPPALIKVTGNILLVHSNAAAQRHAQLQGLWLKSLPDIDVDYSSGEEMDMEVTFGCDRVIWQPSLFAPEPGSP